ncbi:MAG: hypothetical protein R3C11_10955 [Planctomycetaceae bacterium]
MNVEVELSEDVADSPAEEGFDDEMSALLASIQSQAERRDSVTDSQNEVSADELHQIMLAEAAEESEALEADPEIQLKKNQLKQRSRIYLTILLWMPKGRS